LVNWPFAKVGEDILPKAAFYVFGMARNPGMALFVVPFQGYSLQGVHIGHFFTKINSLAFSRGIKVGLELLAKLIAFFSRIT